jgi:hypothetical protein
VVNPPTSQNVFARGMYTLYCCQNLLSTSRTYVGPQPESTDVYLLRSRNWQQSQGRNDMITSAGVGCPENQEFGNLY